MLHRIQIASEASYSTSGEVLTNLKALNFIFGTNGSGKTTISRVIAAPENHPSCSLTWAKAQPLECLVYNVDFASRTYIPQMPGIFTLGEEAGDTLAKIKVAEAKVSELQGDIAKLLGTLGPEDKSSGKRGDLRALRAAFEDECWKIKNLHDSHFAEAFSGVRNSKERFCDKFLSEFAANTAKLATIDELKKRAVTVFEKGLERQAAISLVDASDLIALEGSPVLTKKVVGKDDLDIAALIRRLGNSDWVRHGLGYLGAGGGQCPFCQQDITAALSKDLNDYFDQTFLDDMAAIDKVGTAYATYSTDLLGRLEIILTLGNRYIDEAGLRAAMDRLASRIELNKRLLERKRKEPSAPVSLDGLAEFVEPIMQMLSAANTSITAHNAMVDNLASEQVTLKSEIWKCLLDGSSAALTAYTSSKSGLDKAIDSLSAAIVKKRSELGDVRTGLKALEKTIASVQPTVSAINSTLTSFGFTSFRLATAGEHGNLYEIIRNDGSNAAKTLSEGEKSFITFLYFYHLIRGSISESGMTADRIIVFDDPVSSLDSDVLFIVSALIKSVLSDACKSDGRIKQVFVLTHNIYFHKEVSFDPDRSDKCRAHETFWIVRKVADLSTVTEYKYNPIKTSYELLWAEVKNPNRSTMTIQNTLRRILESYFRILGNLKKDDIVAQFEGKEQQICNTLFSWVNDGSHGVHDDLYISADEQVVDRYLAVFRSIFVKTNHLGHYQMMMGPELVVPAPVVPPEPVEVSELAAE
jgi:wobble nucleotide-excising tRNase